MLLVEEMAMERRSTPLSNFKIHLAALCDTIGSEAKAERPDMVDDSLGRQRPATTGNIHQLPLPELIRKAQN